MLQLNNIAVKYSYKTVLDGVDLSFEDGKIYSLLGENGAGKSTLAGIICGDRTFDSGSIIVDSINQNFSSPKDAIKNGILCVHQRPVLCDEISIKENFLLGLKKYDEKYALELMSYFLPGRKLNTFVRELSLSERFFASLIGILLKNPKFLILDEPSALLDEEQSNILFSFLHQLTEKGLTLLLITHFLKEALTQSDYVVLLKGGRVLCQKESSKITENEIVELLYEGSSAEDFSTSAEYKDFLSQENVVYLKTKNAQEFIKKEREISVRLRADGKRCGIIPSDRTFNASDPSLTILQICTAHKTNLPSKNLYHFCTDLLKRAQVNITPEEKASNLSGGMLQRIILERELSVNPEVLILCAPFQGLDFFACKTLFEKLKAASVAGMEIVILEAEK